MNSVILILLKSPHPLNKILATPLSFGIHYQRNFVRRLSSYDLRRGFLSSYPHLLFLSFVRLEPRAEIIGGHASACANAGRPEKYRRAEKKRRRGVYLPRERKTPHEMSYGPIKSPRPTSTSSPSLPPSFSLSFSPININ